MKTEKPNAGFRLGRTVGLSLAAFLLLGTSTALAGTSSKIKDLEQRVEMLEQQVKQAAKNQDELNTVKEELKKEKAKVAAIKPPPSDDDQLIKFSMVSTVVADFMASDKKGSHSSFVGGKFLPIFLASYSDWLLAESHLEFTTNSDGGTDVSLEYAQLDFLVNDWLTITAGKFLSPIGQFQQAQHPPWINKLPDRPVGFVEDGGDEPLSEVGIMARGGFPIGSTKATYAIFVGNGPRLEDAGPALEGYGGGDDNSDKAFGGRFSIFVIPHLEVGVSAMHARIKGNEAMGGTPTSADYDMFGADAAFTRGYWDIRGEYIHGHLDRIMTALDPADATPTAVPATTWNNFYVQAAYRLAGITKDPVIGNFEPVVRYSQMHVDGFDDYKEGVQDRWSFGLDYWFAPSVVAKIAYENRDMPMMPSVNVFRAQVAFGF